MNVYFIYYVQRQIYAPVNKPNMLYSRKSLFLHPLLSRLCSLQPFHSSPPAVLHLHARKKHPMFATTKLFLYCFLWQQFRQNSRIRLLQRRVFLTTSFEIERLWLLKKLQSSLQGKEMVETKQEGNCGNVNGKCEGYVEQISYTRCFTIDTHRLNAANSPKLLGVDGNDLAWGVVSEKQHSIICFK